MSAGRRRVPRAKVGVDPKCQAGHGPDEGTPTRARGCWTRSLLRILRWRRRSATRKNSDAPFWKLCLKYDRTLGDMMMSRSWRVGRLLSAIWARLPAFLQRQILRMGRRVWPRFW